MWNVSKQHHMRAPEFERNIPICAKFTGYNAQVEDGQVGRICAELVKADLTE